MDSRRPQRPRSSSRPPAGPRSARPGPGPGPGPGPDSRPGRGPGPGAWRPRRPVGDATRLPYRSNYRSGSQPPGAAAAAAPAAPPRPVRTPEPLDLATRVIRGSDAKHPADAVLRATLKDTGGIRPEVAAATARLVFGYFRWRGLIGRGLPLSRQVETAADYARQFAQQPETFSDAMLADVIPAWARKLLAPEHELAWRRSLQTEPRLWLRARPGTGGELALELGDCFAPYPDLLPDALVYQGSSDLFRHPAFQAGRFELQDLASQWVGHLCNPHPGETWWDTCAGEGGKTLHLAALMQNKGVVWGTDRADRRLDRLRLRASRAGLFNIRWESWTGTGAPPIHGRVHGVLVDAPCTGLGTWQRNPHARWTTRPEEITELAATQLRLLRAAAHRVGPGGRLVYSVCTLTAEETTGVATAFAEAEPNFTPEPIPAPWRPPGAAGPEHQTWIWPQDRGSNGMFIGQWRRKP